MKTDEAGPLRANFERADRRHPNSTSATRALCFGTVVVARRANGGAASSSLTGSAATACSEAIDHVRDRDHSRIAALYGFAIDVADAQAPFQQVGDRLEWGGTRHHSLGI
jgi:hypothetical protein